MDDVTLTSASDQATRIEFTAAIVAAYVSNNSVPASEMPALLSMIYGAISGLNDSAAPTEPKPERATPSQIRKSIADDALISFEDGKSYKTLKRHLTKMGITPEQYRQKWGLPHDYPMTAAAYSKMRSSLAKNAGLGQLRRNAAPKVADIAEPVAEAPKARSRKNVAKPAAAPADKPGRARKPKKATAE